MRCPHILKHLNTWSPVGGAVWLSLGGVALPEEVCHWGLMMRFQKSGNILSLTCLFLFPAFNLRCELSVHHACLLPLFSTMIAITPNPSQTQLSTADQAFKHMNLWGPRQSFHSLMAISVIIQPQIRVHFRVLKASACR